MTSREDIAKLLDESGLILSAKGKAAILANIAVESGHTFDFTKKQEGGKAVGLFQFDPGGPMPKVYKHWLKLQGETDSANSQINFMADVIKDNFTTEDGKSPIGGGNARKLQKSLVNDSAEDATLKFMSIFERPGIPHEEARLAVAKDIVENMQLKDSIPIPVDNPFNKFDTPAKTGTTNPFDRF
jgi:hypothetical protein